MTDPFERPDGRYLALGNEDGQYSLWPSDLAVPDGWLPVHGPDSRAACLDHVERAWTDPRPASLLAAEGRSR
ncbi:MbtH family protein [Streptomyces sp. NBC_00441]|uniref:MbtH family protein n=1 Tax=Streptomyces sp. NBC_00441 TaxID=2975742 RepID=UPI002E29D55D|nr:MbtH family protein [Streptomyces sp. NBC_00441]